MHLVSQLASRLAQVDSFPFFAAAFIIVAAILAFTLLDLVVKAVRDWINARYAGDGRGCFPSFAVHPEHRLNDSAHDDDNVSSAPQVRAGKAVAEATVGIHGVSSAASGVTNKPLKLLGLPEFDIAVRSKLLIGPDSYQMKDLPRYFTCSQPFNLVAWHQIFLMVWTLC